MSARETAAEREERMMRVAAGRQEPTPPQPRRPATVRTRPVRLTVDMPPELHRKLKFWAMDLADAHGVTDVPLADVVRVLVRRLMDDDALHDAVAADLRALRDGKQ